ncbi:hypothetical protein WJX82_008949 [Trebouxia sp. C0006]
MVVDDSLKHPIAAVRCSLQQPAGVKERNERPQKRHRLSTDPSAVTLRVADSKPVSVTTGDARATLNLKADENNSRAGVQLSTYFETKEHKLMKRELQLIRKANKEGEVEKARLDREDRNIDAQAVLCTDRYAIYDSSLLKCWSLI